MRKMLLACCHDLRQLFLPSFPFPLYEQEAANAVHRNQSKKPAKRRTLATNPVRLPPTDRAKSLFRVIYRPMFFLYTF